MLHGTLSDYIFNNLSKLRQILGVSETDLTVDANAKTINYRGMLFVIDDNGTVTKVQEGITITNGDITLAAGINDQEQLNVAQVNVNTTITWTTSDPSTVTVDSTGKVTALAAGSATITASGTELRKKL